MWYLNVDVTKCWQLQEDFKRCFAIYLKLVTNRCLWPKCRMLAKCHDHQQHRRDIKIVVWYNMFIRRNLIFLCEPLKWAMIKCMELEQWLGNHPTFQATQCKNSGWGLIHAISLFGSLRMDAPMCVISEKRRQLIKLCVIYTQGLGLSSSDIMN